MKELIRCYRSLLTSRSLMNILVGSQELLILIVLVDFKDFYRRVFGGPCVSEPKTLCNGCRVIRL